MYTGMRVQRRARCTYINQIQSQIQSIPSLEHFTHRLNSDEPNYTTKLTQSRELSTTIRVIIARQKLHLSRPKRPADNTPTHSTKAPTQTRNWRLRCDISHTPPSCSALQRASRPRNSPQSREKCIQSHTSRRGSSKGYRSPRSRCTL
ncbi:hypothetical protein BJX64DRAFT_257925 [Aspergillus heterothallicus]